MLPKGPGAIGKPLARSAEREPFPYGFRKLSVQNQRKAQKNRIGARLMRFAYSPDYLAAETIM